MVMVLEKVIWPLCLKPEGPDNLFSFISITPSIDSENGNGTRKGYLAPLPKTRINSSCKPRNDKHDSPLAGGGPVCKNMFGNVYCCKGSY